MSGWETLDVAALLAARDAQHESTTSANAGGYVHPIGVTLRRQTPTGDPGRAQQCHGNDFCPLNFEEWAAYYGR